MTRRVREAMQQFVWFRPPGYTRAVVRLISIAITAQVAQIPARTRLTAGGKGEGPVFVVYPMMKLVNVIFFFSFFFIEKQASATLSHSCLKVHGGVPIALNIFLDPLVLRINCLVIRE